MLDHERLSNDITWIDLSFVERRRTPEWAIQVGIRCHLAGMSLRDASQFLEELGVDRSHVAIHDWVHNADLQPISTVSADQLAVDEKMIRLHGQQFWLYGAVDPQTNEILHLSLLPPLRNRRHGGFWTIYIVAISSTTSYLLSMTPITLLQYWPKMAIDFRYY